MGHAGRRIECFTRLDPTLLPVDPRAALAAANNTVSCCARVQKSPLTSTPKSSGT